MQETEAFEKGGIPLSVNYQYRNSTKSWVIYHSVIFSIIAAIALLPFIEIPVSIKGAGVIQSETERLDVIIPINGKILKVMVSDNQKVAVGDTLLILDASVADHQAKLLRERGALLKHFLGDIDRSLASLNQAEAANIVRHYDTQQFDASWNHFFQQLMAKRNMKRQHERNFARYRYLYDNNVVTASELEKFELEYDLAVSDCLMLERQYRSHLHDAAATYREELKKLEADVVAANEKRRMFTLVSPARGSIQNFKPPGVGTYGLANQKIAEISPDGRLWAFCFVKVKDIGLVRTGQAVNYQLEPYNHYRWGTISGKVEEVFDDVTLVNNVPVFKVRCSLSTDHLDLKGYKAYLKKGMSFTVRFSTGEHTLFSLLWGRARDIVDPEMDTAS